MTTSTPRPDLLFISRMFPPVGGVGSLRTAGFARELTQLGWTVTALTVSRRSLDATLRDDSLETFVPSTVRRLEARDIAAEIGARLRKRLVPQAAAVSTPQLRRPKGTTVGNIWRRFTLPDVSLTWAIAAVASGWRASKSATVVYSCGLPLGSHLVGWALSRVSGRGWVCDFRDPYVWPGLRHFASPLHEAFGRWLEKRIIHAADHVVVANDAFLEYYARRYPAIRGKLTSIMNGYDGPAADPTPTGSGPLTLAHAGQFQDDDALQALIDALVVARRSGHKVELTMAGTISPGQQATIRESEVRDHVTLLGRVPHDKVDAVLAGADLLIADACGPLASMAVRAKIFEYAQARKPILALTNAGSALEGVVARYRIGYSVAPDDVEALAGFLGRMSDRKAGGHSLFPADPPDVDSLSRVARAKELDGVLRSVRDARKAAAAS